MTVREAISLERKLGRERSNYKSLLMRKPHHSDFGGIQKTIIKLEEEINGINELLDGMLLEDTYTNKALEFLTKYEEVLND